jgi:hypothetical protein
MVANGTSTALSSISSNFVSATNYARLADESNTSFTVYSTYTVPATVKAGDAGSAWAATTYQSSARIVAPGTARVVATYLAAKDTSTSLLVTFLVDSYGDPCDLVNTTSVPSFCETNLSPTHIFNTHTRQSQTVYRVNTSGAITLVSIRQDVYADTGAVYQSILFTF